MLVLAFVGETDVLPANGEEAAQGNHIETTSIDAAGFNGPLPPELEDSEDLAINVFTPPPRERQTKFFTPDDFVEGERQVVGNYLPIQL